MAEYVSVRSNWLSIDSISLERICDIDIEDRNQSTTVDKQDECHEQDDLRLVFLIVLFQRKETCFRVVNYLSYACHVLFEYDFFYNELLYYFVEYR